MLTTIVVSSFSSKDYTHGSVLPAHKRSSKKSLASVSNYNVSPTVKFRESDGKTSDVRAPCAWDNSCIYDDMKKSQQSKSKRDGAHGDLPDFNLYQRTECVGSTTAISTLRFGTLASASLHFPCVGERDATQTTLSVLNDIFFTYTGCRSLDEFAAYQKAGSTLRRALEKGSRFPDVAVQPVCPELLQELYETRMSGRDLMTLDVLPGPSCDTRGGAGAITLPPNGIAASNNEVSYLPAWDELEPPTRCDTAALHFIRAKVNEYVRCALGLLTLTKSFSGRWGRLTSEERVMLQVAMREEHQAHVKTTDILARFRELDLSSQRLCSVGEELLQCREVHTLCLTGNPDLHRIAYLPPSCHSLVANACGLEALEATAASDRLTVMGVAYNNFSSLQFLDLLPNIRILDASFNDLCSMEDTIQCVCRHPALTEVTLLGNPIALLDDYRVRLATSCQNLQKLDGHLITAEERQGSVFLVEPKEAPCVLKGKVASKKAPGGKHSSTPKVVEAAIPVDDAALRWKTQNTIAAKVNLLGVHGIRSLLHTPMTVTSVEELQPLASLVQRAVGGMHKTSGSRYPSLKVSASDVAVPHSRGKKTQGKVAGNVPLYDIRTTLALRGCWGQTSALAERSAQSGVGDAQIGISISDATDTGVAIELIVSEISPTPFCSGKGGGHGSVSLQRSRRHAPEADHASIEDIHRPQDRGTFSADLPLHHGLCKQLSQPLRLEVEVRDEVFYYTDSMVRLLLEGGGRNGGAAQRHGNAHNEKSSPDRTSDRDPMSSLSTNVYHLGTIVLNPSTILGQDNFLATAAAVDGQAGSSTSSWRSTTLNERGSSLVSPSCPLRRELCTMGAEMILCESDLLRGEDDVRCAEEELHAALLRHHQLEEMIEEAMRVEEKAPQGTTALGASVVSAPSSRHNAVRKGSTTASTATVGASVAGSSRKRGSIRGSFRSSTQTKQLQQSLVEESSKVFGLAVKVLSTKQRIEELRRVRLAVDAQFTLGRGPGRALPIDHLAQAGARSRSKPSGGRLAKVRSKVNKM